MLELRPSCECCGKALPPSAEDAMICSFECTFCAECVATRLDGRCPNCGGAFMPRPIRPEGKLAANPPSSQRIYDPRGCGQQNGVNSSEMAGIL
jgi:hypothetical protein